ncbi:hypothetical protein [Roseovarius confluentis]|uniref:hypothetical protein n=1 Tax=Roseovarius confluentis TaxID=1852027 RepID=UPI003BAA5858
MTDQVTLNVEGRKVKVDKAFLDLSPEEQQATVEEIAGNLSINRREDGFMGQLNQGIAESVGGLVDFINPFDTPAVANAVGLDFSTGSATTGIENVMDATGVRRAQNDPETLWQSVGRGAGSAAGSAVPAGATARALSGAGGLLGSVADDAAQTLNTVRGTVSELMAGGAARAAENAAERAGAPEWAQNTAAIAGGVGVGALPYAASKTPSAIGARKLSGALKSAMMPYTEQGAMEVARRRVQELAGGPERAAELARGIQAGSEINLTPAQRTQDPNMLALEQTAARQNPLLRERLEERMRGSVQSAESGIQDMGGDVTAAQGFFQKRRADARAEIQGHVDRATEGALRPEARNPESLNSQRVAEQIRRAEKQADIEEARLWEAVPKGAQVGTVAARRVANELIQSTPRAQQELRRVARSAMAGTDQNRNKARIANSVADAILDDLGANAGQTPIGQAIDAARAYSAAKHEVFDQGTVGKLLKRTLDGDEQIDPRMTLERSVGRGGTVGSVALDDLGRASNTSGTQSAIEDFLRSRFDRTAFKADGSFNDTAARNFLRDNAETLEQMPALRDTLAQAVQSQTRASATSTRATRVFKDMDNPNKSSTAAFAQAVPESAVDQVFKSKRPSLSARQLAATARKDKSGAAVDGLKGAFGDYLIRRSMTSGGLSGDKMRDFLQTPEYRSALMAAFEPPEIRRLDMIAAELRKLDTARKAAPDIGALSNRSPNRIIEYAARIIAARQGAQAGGSGGGSIQTAQMASGRVKALLGNLQNDKAEQLLMDAVEDPELFRLLLVDPGSVRLKLRELNKLAPYFTGAAAGTAEEREQ